MSDEQIEVSAILQKHANFMVSKMTKVPMAPTMGLDEAEAAINALLTAARAEGEREGALRMLQELIFDIHSERRRLREHGGVQTSPLNRLFEKQNQKIATLSEAGEGNGDEMLEAAVIRAEMNLKYWQAQLEECKLRGIPKKKKTEGTR